MGLSGMTYPRRSQIAHWQVWCLLIWRGTITLVGLYLSVASSCTVVQPTVEFLLISVVGAQKLDYLYAVVVENATLLPMNSSTMCARTIYTRASRALQITYSRNRASMPLPMQVEQYFLADVGAAPSTNCQLYCNCMSGTPLPNAQCMPNYSLRWHSYLSYLCSTTVAFCRVNPKLSHSQFLHTLQLQRLPKLKRCKTAAGVLSLAYAQRIDFGCQSCKLMYSKLLFSKPMPQNWLPML